MTALVRLIELADTDIELVVPEAVLHEIITDAERHEKLFYELFSVVLKTCAATHNKKVVSPKDIEKIEQWIRENYIDLRKTMPRELKDLYLKELAFRTYER